MGYVVLEARDGSDVLTVSRSFSGRVDLVVSDVRMPRMDGGNGQSSSPRASGC